MRYIRFIDPSPGSDQSPGRFYGWRLSYFCFGHEVYVRESGTPYTETKTFAVPNPSPTCTVEIHEEKK